MTQFVQCSDCLSVIWEADLPSVIVKLLIACGPGGKDVGPYRLDKLGHDLASRWRQVRVKVVNSSGPLLGGSAIIELVPAKSLLVAYDGLEFAW